MKRLGTLLPLRQRPAALLVCETDGFTLRGAVLARRGDGLDAAYTAHSRAQDLGAAVAELVERLRGRGWKPGGRAILLMPGVVSAPIGLPVPPKTPRPPMQMLELVRWELEPLLLEHTTQWTVGQVLVGLGFLSEEQAREVLARQQGKFHGKEAQDRLEIYSLKRFGEVAVEHGYIERSQLEEALARQVWLRIEGDEMACGWQPLPAAEHGGDGLFRWLASGINRELMGRWAAAFSVHGVELASVFPTAGCASALVGTETAAVVIETGGGQVTGVRLGKSGPEAIVTQQAALGGALEGCLEAWHKLTPPEPERVWITDAGGVADTFASVIGRPALVLQAGVSGPADQVSAGMAGAARVALGLSAGSACCGVPVRGPRVPWRHHPAFRLVAGCAAVVLAIALAEAALQVRQHFVGTHAARVEARAAELDGALERARQRSAAADKLEAQIQARRDEAARLAARTAFFGDELPRRSALLQALFDELMEVVTEEVVVDRFAEEPKKGIVVSAWALTERAAQQFAESLRLGVESWNMALAEVVVGERVGRLGLPGYAVQFRIVDPVTAPQAAAAVPVRTSQAQRRKP